MTENESVTYTLIIENPGREEPDWTPLEEQFEILNRSSSTNMQVINGSTSYSRRYQLSLMPKTTGLLQIPPIQVGKERSNGIELIVKLATSQQNEKDKNLYLEVEATPNDPYVHSQVLLSVRLFIGLPLSQGALSEPTMDDVTIKKLGEDKQYTTTRGARNYQVIERRYALFPEKPGSMTIPSIRFEGTVGSRNSFFDPFSQRGPTKRVHSAPIQFTIRPIPENAPAPWLAARELKGSLDWSAPLEKIQAGTPVTATIRLTAQNSLAKFLPDPQLQSDGKLRTYSDQPQWKDTSTSQGISGTVEKKITFIAPGEGTYSIAPLTISYWNIQKDAPETLTIKGADLQVLPTPGVQESTPPKEEASSIQANSPSAPATLAVAPRSWKEHEYWFWISCLLATGWAATGLFLLRSKKRISQVTRSKEHSKSSNDKLGRQLKQVCQQGDAEAARQLLGEEADLITPAMKETASQELAEYKRQKTLLNRYLYSATRPEQPWDGDALYKSWVALRKASLHKHQNTKEPLAELYD